MPEACLSYFFAMRYIVINPCSVSHDDNYVQPPKKDTATPEPSTDFFYSW